jgi:hypothetical protein
MLATQIRRRRIGGWLVDNGLGKVWKKTFRAFFQIQALFDSRITYVPEGPAQT